MVGYCLLRHAQSFCNSVLRDAKLVHAKYLYVHAHPGCRPKVGDIGIYCLSGTADDLSDFRRGQTGIVLKCLSRGYISSSSMMSEMGILVVAFTIILMHSYKSRHSGRSRIESGRSPDKL